MRRWMLRLPLLLLAPAFCGLQCAGLSALPIETSFAFTNFSQTFYAVLAIRAHSEDGEESAYFMTPLQPPGATYRQRFLDAIGQACPDAVDLRVLLYKRIKGDLPIGLDEGEAVESAPVAAGEVLNVPACSVQPVETYTIVNWDAPEGTARVKIAQGSPVEPAIVASGLFPNADAAWEFAGVDADLATVEPPALAEFEPIDGRVTLADGSGVAGVGVWIQTRYRVRLDDDDPDNDPDVGYSEPIDYTYTDETGRFALSRPAGAYRVECFSDDYAFRPGAVEIETPLESISVIAEPL